MTNSDSHFVSSINSEFSEAAAQKKAAENNLEYINLKSVTIDYDAISLFSKAEALEKKSVVFYKKDNQIKVATCQFDNVELEKFCQEQAQKGTHTKIYICSNESIAFGLGLYESELVARKKIVVENFFDETQPKTIAEIQSEAEKISAEILNIPTKTLLSKIYILALSSATSDIHFCPEESTKGFLVRFRIDGVLHPLFKIPPKITQNILTEIKYASGMRTNITQTPQDGRSSFVANKRNIELRSSTIPAKPFESITLRILDSSKSIRSFSELGFSESIEEKIKKTISQTNGIILVTGPTGSGKTTTLYSLLKELNTSDKNLITLEDPIEYRLPGVIQSEVSLHAEYDFDAGFSSILRHDPDVILIGEMRTEKTVKLAFEAALTGHTVLSSLHTNSSLASISRLRNMGIEDFNIAPTINAIFSQKLVRKTKEGTVFVKKNTDELLKDKRFLQAIKRIQSVFPDQKIPPEILFAPQNPNQDFYGQAAVAEVFIFDEVIREKILNKESEYRIKSYLEENTDFLNIFESGLLEVLKGNICFSELERVC